jgi:uncharacterized metal-binding protein (TIGR02443 family)
MICPKCNSDDMMRYVLRNNDLMYECSDCGHQWKFYETEEIEDDEGI